MDAIVVVPSNRPTELAKFLNKWQGQIERSKVNVKVFIVEDGPVVTNLEELVDKTFLAQRVTHFCWEDIDTDLGEHNWIIPRRTDCVRSYGFLKAYKERPYCIISMDDDCYPNSIADFFAAHMENLTVLAVDNAWRSTLGAGAVPRGVPYHGIARTNQCVVNHGLWTNIADLDAVGQLSSDRHGAKVHLRKQVIPRGSYFPMCGMNVAFNVGVTPAMYQLLMGPKYPYDRFGDIWSGTIMKKICDHLGYAVRSGDPMVHHDRKSNVWANLRKEAPGMEINEIFWKVIDSKILVSKTFASCYKEIADHVMTCDYESVEANGYFSQLGIAMRRWASFFEEQA